MKAAGYRLPATGNVPFSVKGLRERGAGPRARLLVVSWLLITHHSSLVTAFPARRRRDQGLGHQFSVV